jgi:tetratricopeptide (TPR) repeat protein
VPADPWFPFEPRHYQHGMVTDIHNHSQPALISREAYDRTSGWDGFEEFLFAGADCDIFTKVEQVGPIVLLDELLYHYRLSGRRTSLRITDSAAYEMWRRLADGTIARIGLPLERENERPPFRYRRLPRPRPTLQLIDFVVVPAAADASGAVNDALLRTVKSLQRIGVAHDAIRVCPPSREAAARNETLFAAAKPIVCLLWAGVELKTREQIDALLAVMDERGADVVGPKIVTASGAIRSASPAFDPQGMPIVVGGGEPDRGQFDEVAAAAWLAPSAIVLRREVAHAVGGFDLHYDDGFIAAADFCLKARLRDLSCAYVGTVAIEHDGPDPASGTDAERRRFHDRWQEAAHLLASQAVASSGPTGAADGGEAPGLSYEALCARANDALATFRPDEALPLFESAAALWPEGAGAHEGQGRALGALNRWPDAAVKFAEAVRLQPDAFWIQYQFADALKRCERYDEAVGVYERAIALDPQAAHAHAGLGHTLFRLQSWRLAAAAFQRAIALDAEAFWAHYELGTALVRLDRLQDAAVVFRRASQLNHPEVFWAHHSLGDVFQAQGKWEDASAAYQQAVKLRYEIASTHVQLGGVLVHLERWTEAAVAYERAVALDPSNGRAHISLGHVLSALSRWEDAIAAYRQGLTLDSDNAAGHSGLAHALFRMARWDEAAASYRQASALFPASSDWHHSLGDALLNLGRIEEAREAFQLAGELNPSWSQRPLPARVAAAERWLDSRLPDPASRSAGPRTLFVFDSDYGELSTAMYLLLGQPLAAGATFLLPSRLFVTNPDILPGRTRHYASVEDVIRAVDADQPEIVFLCSAYIYSFHEAFTLDGLERLVRELRARGCRVVTTDPFLGLLSDLDGSTTVGVDIPADAPDDLRTLKAVLDERLNREFAASARILDGLPHLYPVPPGPSTPDPGVECIAFHNPQLLLGADELDVRASGAGDKPIWLFVLASRDYEVQAIFHGKAAFVNRVAARLEQALRAGRHPVFVGPYDCVQALISRIAEIDRWCVLDGVTLLTFCPFKRFSALVLCAEHVFYWNALSHSMFLRLFNARPAFLFDRGHLVRNVKPLYERIVDWYYQGWDPIYLDPEADLLTTPLEELADRYRAAAERIGARLRQAPSPERMIEELLCGEGQAQGRNS